MRDIVSLLFKADTSELDKAKGKVGGLGKETSNAEKRVNALMKGFKAVGVVAGFATAIGLATSKLAAMGAAALKSADQIGKTSAKLGITAEDLQKLRVRADAASVSTQALEVGFQRFTRRLEEAREGSGKLSVVFKELGVELKDQNGNFKSNIEVFEEFGEKVGQIEDSSRAVASTFAAVDTEGVNLINMFRQSREEQEKLITTAQRYGLVLSNEVIAKAEEYQTELGLIEEGTKRMALQRDLALAPLTIAWAELKNEIAFAGLELAATLGIVEENATMREMKLIRMKEEFAAAADEARRLAEMSDAEVSRERMTGDPEQVRANFLQIAIDKQTELMELEEQVNEDRRIRAEAEAQMAKDRQKRLNDEAAARQLIRDQAIKDAEAKAADEKAAAAEEARIARLDTLTEKWKQAIDPMRQYQLQILEIQSIYEAGKMSAAEYAEAVKVVRDRILETQEAMKKKEKEKEEGEGDWMDQLIEKSLSLETQLKRMRVEGIEGLADSIADMAVSGKASFREFAADFLRQLAKMIIKAAIFRAIASFMGLPPTGNAGGEIANASSGVPSGGSGGFMDSGGRVNAGMAYRIGSGAQPEVFVPSSDGYMIPNNAMGASGGGNVNINGLNVVVQERKDETSQEQALRIGKAIRDQIRPLVVGEMLNQSRAGNALNPSPIGTFGGRS